MTTRQIIEIRQSHPSRDGDGVAIQRIAGMQHAGMDPILMIDELRSQQREDFIGGFPPHPHRGMQTLTYMKAGGIIHEDSQGNRGEIRGGGAQWMSAGRGIIHSEMPTRDTTGLHGFQIWINLPRAQKWQEPAYRDVPGADLPAHEASWGALTAISGRWQLPESTSLQGPLAVLARRASIADLRLAPGADLVLPVPAEHNLMAYVYRGSLAVAGRKASSGQLLVTGTGDQLSLLAGEEGAEALILHGAPLAEPVAHYGPFVMNTREEIDQTLRDYQSGNFP